MTVDLMFRVMIFCRSSRHLRWLSVHPSHPFLVDRKPSASRKADVDLPAADGATSGFCPQRLGRETRGGLGWRCLAGWVCPGGLRCSPQLTPKGQCRGHWQGNLWSHHPHIPQIIIMGRSTCARQRYEVCCGVIPVPNAVLSYCPISNVFAAGCRAVSALSESQPPLTG